MSAASPDSGAPALAHRPSAGARALLALAAVAVAFAAADTYVVVMAMPEMMAAAGIPIDQLQRAAPIISGFLLGYVAMLPLIGRIADLRGRVPVLVFSLVLFAVGSLVTAAAYDMPSMVLGRFAQGVGGGGLVPATLAMVADLYPVERRGVPLGIVSAVQELGSVLGPLFGAVVLAVSGWRTIFVINVVIGVLLALALRALHQSHADPLDPEPDPAPPLRERDWLGAVAAAVCLGAVVLVFVRPASLMRDLTWGQLFVAWIPGSRWATPLGLVAVLGLVLFVVRCVTARHPMLNLREWWTAMREADLIGSLLLAAALGGVILAFATADPQVEVFSPAGVWYLLGSAVALVLFVVHLRRASAPLIPRGALSATPAWGAMLVSFFVGAALIAALIDIPIFARTTVYLDSQVMAALVLLRFLAALPIGAIAGGYLIRWFGAGATAALGMLAAAAGFFMMSRWDIHALETFGSTIALVICGFGFGLALAPVNAAVLAATADEVHGLASAFTVVARMVGMLVGISALTTLGLRRFYAEQSGIPPLSEVCGGQTRCDQYVDLLKQAGIAQEQTVFLGAAVCAVIAAVLALALFRHVNTKGVSAGDLLRSAG